MLRGLCVLFLLVVLYSLFASGRPVLATVRCESQYGGGETCVRTGQLLLDKKVWDGSVFVDNLFASSKKWQNGDEVTFKIDVKNVGDEKLTDVSYTDSLPPYFSWSGGSDLSGAIGTLEVGQTKTLTIKAKVVGAPEGLVCNVNTVEAKASGGFSDRDTAQVCVGKDVLGVTTIPKTGPEMAVLVAIPALGGIGYFLKSRSWKGVKEG